MVVKGVFVSELFGQVGYHVLDGWDVLVGGADVCDEAFPWVLSY